jgi:hypothetical protein
MQSSNLLQLESDKIGSPLEFIKMTFIIVDSEKQGRMFIIKSAAFFTFSTPARVRFSLGEGLEISKLFSPPSDWPKKFSVT